MGHETAGIQGQSRHYLDVFWCTGNTSDWCDCAVIVFDGDSAGKLRQVVSYNRKACLGVSGAKQWTYPCPSSRAKPTAGATARSGVGQGHLLRGQVQRGGISSSSRMRCGGPWFVSGELCSMSCAASSLPDAQLAPKSNPKMSNDQGMKSNPRMGSVEICEEWKI